MKRRIQCFSFTEKNKFVTFSVNETIDGEATNQSCSILLTAEEDSSEKSEGRRNKEKTSVVCRTLEKIFSPKDSHLDSQESLDLKGGSAIISGLSRGTAKLDIINRRSLSL